MTPDELEAFLSRERTARLATVSPDGEPHVVPMWFVWHDGAMFFNSLKRSRRMRDARHDARVSACVDAGHEYGELHGAVLYGLLEPVTDQAVLDDLGRLFGEKYWGGIEIPEVRSHRWMVLRPDRIASWDFKKIPSGRDKRLEATQQE
jgi:general stress protein 26